MRPIRLFMKNFMNHVESEIDCSKFDSVLIVGKSKLNERISNGVGKTTIFNAIEYALFNTSHSTNLDKVVREGSKKMVVEFEFEIGSDKYKVYRHRTARGSGDLRLYKWNDEWESISERTSSQTEKRLSDIIRISHKAFTYSVLFRQADLTGISSVADPKKRKEILKEPLNLSSYTRLEKIAQDRTRPVKREIDKITAGIEVLGDPGKDIREAREKLSECQEEIKDKTSKIENEMMVSLKSKQKHVEDLKSSLSNEDADIHSKLERKKDHISKINRSIKAATTSIEAAEKSLVKHKQSLSSFDGQLSSLSDKLEDLMGSESKDIDELERAIEKERKEFTKLNQQIAVAQAAIEAAKETIPDGDRCFSCQQPITPDYRQEFEKKISDKIKKHRDDIEYYQDLLSKCKKQKDDLEKQLRAASARETEIKEIKSDIKSISFQKENAKELIDSLEEDIYNKSKEKMSYCSELGQAAAEFDSLKKIADQSTVKETNNEIFSIQNEIRMFEKSIASLQDEIKSLSSTKGALEERISQRKSDQVKLEEFYNQLENAKGRLKIHQMVVNAFSHRGIPSLVIQTVLDDLQFETNEALRSIRPELQIQIDSELNIEYFRNGMSREYGQLSHGQHVYIALAFKRGMSRILQKKLDANIATLYFDEVDSALDDAGVEAFADAIRKWQKEFKIFVVTHNKDLKDKFTHAILVEEGDDGSCASVVTTW